jgi:N-acetylneuraminic acid mutarotase
MVLRDSGGHTGQLQTQQKGGKIMNESVYDLIWERLADMPVGKWEPASTVIDEKMYVLGGYESFIKSGKKLHVFDPAAGTHGTWSRLQDLPSAITHVNLVPDATGFWFAGGMKDMCRASEIQDHIIAETWHFDLEQDRYTAGPLLPGTRAGGGLVRVGDNLHYISGLMGDRDTDSPDHWVLDLAEWRATGTGTWQNRAPLPLPRNQLSVAVLDSKIYAIAGQLNHDSQQLDQPRVDIYDSNSDSWMDGPALPYGHSHSEGATFVHNDRIWMVAGHTTPEGEKKGMCGNILTLGVGEDWELTCKAPRAMSSPAARVINDKLYIAGGWDGRMSEAKPEREYWALRQMSSPEVWVADLPVREG